MKFNEQQEQRTGMQERRRRNRTLSFIFPVSMDGRVVGEGRGIEL